jgi:putative transposase
VVRVSGKGSGRISIAGLLAYRVGKRPHLYYRYVVHRGRRGERRSLSEADYATCSPPPTNS